MADNPKLPAVEIAYRTDPGRDPDKQVNEDAAVHVDTALGLLCVVCDGMGGHAGGKEASELATKTIVEIVQAAPAITNPKDALRVAIEEASRRVWSMPTDEGGYRPGSTVVAILAHPGGADVAHVGDSRIYFVHAGAITQITKDHSMVQEMVDRNIIRAEDAASHPDANKIMRALGIAKDVDVDVRSEAIAFASGDVFVLCTDGLSDLVSAGDILDIAGSKPPAQAAGQLVDLANARGGHDNITAMIVRMKSSATAAVAPTIVKTVQLTAHDPMPLGAVPPDVGSGPKTVLAAPMDAGGSSGSMPGGTVPLPPAGHPSASGPAAIPASPSGPHVAVGRGGPDHDAPASTRSSSSRATLVFGILLAIVGVALLAVFVWHATRPDHKPTKIVDDSREASAPPPQEDESDAAATEITPAPPLTPQPSASGKPKWVTDPDAATPNGEPRECLMARWGKTHGKPASDVAALEAKCRERGGKP